MHIRNVNKNFNFYQILIFTRKPCHFIHELRETDFKALVRAFYYTSNFNTNLKYFYTVDPIFVNFFI
jgi:hypothetical protein